MTIVKLNNEEYIEAAHRILLTSSFLWVLHVIKEQLSSVQQCMFYKVTMRSMTKAFRILA